MQCYKIIHAGYIFFFCFRYDEIDLAQHIKKYFLCQFRILKVPCLLQYHEVCLSESVEFPLIKIPVQFVIFYCIFNENYFWCWSGDKMKSTTTSYNNLTTVGLKVKIRNSEIIGLFFNFWSTSQLRPYKIGFHRVCPVQLNIIWFRYSSDT